MSQQTTADGSVWAYDCSCGASAKADPDNFRPVEWTSVTEPGGAGTYTEFTAGALSSYTDEDNRPYSFSYFGRLPLSMTFPEGNQVLWRYNDNYVASGRTLKAKLNSGLQDRAVGFQTFPTICTPATCNKPLTTTDAKGFETDFGYTSFGAPQWQLQAPPTNGAARPLKLFSYVQRSAYRKSGGSLVPAGAPIWVPSTETACQAPTTTGAGQPSSTPVCDANGPQVTTTYEYGVDGTSNSLLVMGKVVTADGQSRRTCMAYDAQGNKISETSARAGLASCS